MNLILIAFTANGLKLEERLGKLLAADGFFVQSFLKSKYVDACGQTSQVEEPLGDWAQKYIPEADGVIFIGATGIAVRTMAPLLKSKVTDPAVVVLDEKGQFAISLLSGHLGGANALTNFIAAQIGAVPVITTATDVNHRFAVDVFAEKNHLWISDMKLAKEVSALILQGETLKAGLGDGGRVWSPQKELSQLSLSLENSPDGKKGTFWIALPKGEVLHLVPRCMSLGIGCKKGTEKEKIENLAAGTLEKAGIFPQAIARVASIDLKKEEKGLLGFCKAHDLPLKIYSCEELKGAKGTFSSSPFVSRITGVDNVCERSAHLAAGKGRLLIKKQASEGVTIACAVEDWSVNFE